MDIVISNLLLLISGLRDCTHIHLIFVVFYINNNIINLIKYTYNPVIRDGKLYGRGGADDGYAVSFYIYILPFIT